MPPIDSYNAQTISVNVRTRRGIYPVPLFVNFLDVSLRGRQMSPVSSVLCSLLKGIFNVY
jgi:hypothetical protein